MIRHVFRASVLCIAFGLAAPDQAVAQSCSPPGGEFTGSGTMNCSGSYSQPTTIVGDNLNVTVEPGTVMDVPFGPGSLGTIPPAALIVIDALLTGNPNSLTVNNAGSLTITDLGQGLSAQGYSFYGLAAVMTGASGSNGSPPGGGGNTMNPLSVTNTGSITVSLPYTELRFGDGLLALSQGGNGGSDSSNGGNGGNSAGTTVTNSGAITVNVGTSGGWGGGSAGFGGIEASSLGGNAGTGNNGANGGTGGASSVTNSAPVNVTFNWVNDQSSIGLYGILAQTQGGNGTGAKGNNNVSGGFGGNAYAASVTLNSGGNVALNELNSPPGAGIAAPFYTSAPNNIIYNSQAENVPAENVPVFLANVVGAGVAAEAIGGNGGFGQEENNNAGSGGNASGAQTITVTDANVNIIGSGLPGLLIWSQGGNGGVGATENDGSQSGSAYSNGGHGGGVDAGATVNVTAQTQNVSISTEWYNSPGIAAFMLGGDGGDVNVNTHDDGHNTNTQGGDGGNVYAADTVNLTGTNGYRVQLTTSLGTNSPGIYAVSQGGNGGYGGDYLPSLSHGQGGNGGNGGYGGDVNVTLQSASISTQGATSPGIIAQSQGGVGGTGGYGSGGAGTTNGGNGGNGGATGNVNVSLDSVSLVMTQGADSSGIIAQTLSGAGGDGGGQGGHQGNAGSGGAGGAAGNVTVTNNGLSITNGTTTTLYGIITSGDASRGILAQSLAGAGGPGGNAGGFFNNAGGTGGASGSAGTVTVNNNGTIITSGTDSQGILAQSIGGGGGAGGSAGGYGAIGGNGALGADGNVVTVNSQSGSITTTGLSSAGIMMQSIGGGGGDGGGASGSVITVGGSGGGGGNGAGLGFSSGAGSQITTNGDYSPAILLQSIGGGGGNAGNASSFTPFASVAIGGTGGAGGSGGVANGSDNGWVTVNTSHTYITTVGTKSPGIVAQSIGGGGGMGGNAFASSVGAGVAVSVGDGGSGGSGGNGGNVWVNVQQETIATGQNPLLVNGQPLASPVNGCTSLPCNTLPVDDYGVVVQSIGGGGGLGGSATAQAVALAVPLPETNLEIGFGASAAIGGKGGNGGNGGTAQFQLSNGGNITTNGQGSTAVLVQSIGGGGGAGGDSSSLAAVVGPSSVPDGVTSINLAVTFELGGSGGNGGSGGTVDVALGGTISSSGTLSADPSGSAATSIVTYGDFANGVTAQSIGGGGGNAGFGSSNTEAFGGGNDVTINVGLGGLGGAGNTGGTVNVSTFPDSSITTYGSGAVGILAQSIGGGGGASQGDAFSVGVPIGGVNTTEKFNLGLGGGGGGPGGAVNVSVSGPITTHGGDAIAVVAQSIGGGGGLGGSAGSDASADNPIVDAATKRQSYDNVKSTLQGNPPLYATFTQSIGGTGGTGGNGGSVTVDLSNAIMTSGDWADGVVAQSVGGGGGIGGSAAATGTGGVSTVSINSEVAVGGTGGSGGYGGQVTVNLNGSNLNQYCACDRILTAGFGAAGILAQSIAGGGGIGADGSDQAAGTFTVGASGNGGGGSGGNGGTVTLTNGAFTEIGTTGAAADSVVLQSIGGGGGIAGAGSSLFTAAWAQSGSLTLKAGGGSGVSGYGGQVTFDSGSNPIIITTNGNDAFGILAQSIGGGGGSVISQPSSSSITTSIGGGSNDANSVTVTMAGGSASYISTTGIAADGIVAQSIGGGGGVIRVVNAAGDTPALTTWMGDLTAVSNASGSGASVTVTANGNIRASGAGAVGIFAQSVGGGGGLVIDGNSIQAGTTGGSGSAGWGGTVNVTANGTISTMGVNGIDIFAQSTGPNGGGQIDVTVNNQISGGNGAGATYTTPGSAAVVVDSPSGSPAAQVTFESNSYVFIPVSGTAVLASGGGSANVTNETGSTINGNFYLNGGASSNAVATLTNYGTVNAGTMIDANVVNGGTMNVGLSDTGATQTTTVTGDFTQTSGGKLDVLIDSLSHTAGLLQVNGTASLDGTIIPIAKTLMPGTVSVVNAGNLITSASALDSLLFKWRLDRSGNTLALTPIANFNPGGTGLTGSESSLANYLSEAWAHSSPIFATLFADLSRITDAGLYARTLDEFSPQSVEAQSIALINSAGAILGSAMSCPVFVDQSVQLGEDDCIWATTSGGVSDQKAATDTSAYRVSGMTYRLGGQHEIAPKWYLGGSIAIGQSWAQSGYGKTFDGSVSLKHTMGPWLFAGSVAVASGSFQTERTIGLSNIGASLYSNPGVFLGGGRLRAGYEFGFNDWYIRPYGDLDVIYTRLSGFQESASAFIGPISGSNFGLDVRGSSKTTVALSPMVELGGRLRLNDQFTLRPFAAVGMSFVPDNTRTLDASFHDASLDLGTFRSFLKSPSALADFDVGLQLYSANGFDVKVGYTANVGSSFLSQTGSARLAYHF